MVEGRLVLRVASWLGSSASMGRWAVVWLDCRCQLGSLALVVSNVVGSSTMVWCGLCCVIVWLVCCAVVG